MKLDEKHIIPYLPFDLKVVHTQYIDFGKKIEKVDTLIGFHQDCCTFTLCPDWYFDTEENDCSFKPILHPLSDLTKEIEVNGEKFVPIEFLEDYIDFSYGYERIEYWKIQKLFEWNFDVFGLIPAGLAIDINTLNK